jgi:hypothetical protein
LELWIYPKITIINLYFQCFQICLFVLASIGKAWHHGGDVAGRGNFAGGNHNQKLHQMVVNLAATVNLSIVYFRGHVNIGMRQLDVTAYNS